MTRPDEHEWTAAVRSRFTQINGSMEPPLSMHPPGLPSITQDNVKNKIRSVLKETVDTVLECMRKVPAGHFGEGKAAVKVFYGLRNLTNLG